MLDLAGIVRFEDEEKYGLAHRYIFGLNLLVANDVEDRIEERPDIVFLQHLTEQINCSAQVSAVYLNDRAESPMEMFGAAGRRQLATDTAQTSDAHYCLVNQAGFYDGFFDLQGGYNFNGQVVDGGWVAGNVRYGDCFFPRVTAEFWDALDREEGALRYLILSHGLVLYVGPKHANAARDLERLLDSQFVSESHVVKEAVNHFEIVLAVGHDGQFCRAFAKNYSDFALLDPSLTAATKAIEASAWFRTNRGRLAWSTELDECLMLPK